LEEGVVGRDVCIIIFYSATKLLIMKFSEFKIKNFKGIEDITVNLIKSPEANIYTLVGLNESGKTTILEALNFFNFHDKGLSALDLPGVTIKDYNSIIPICQRDNFNDIITLEVALKLDKDDLKKINEFVKENTAFRQVKPVDALTYYNNYSYKDSKYESQKLKWDGFSGWPKNEQVQKFIKISDTTYAEDNFKLATFCRTLIPSILYFPNFLFDFPSRIYLETNGKPTAKDEFYIELVQDILNSLENKTNYETHIIERAKSKDRNDKRNLDSLLQKMNRKVTEIVFDAWNRIFKRNINDTEVIIRCDIDEEGNTYLEFEIESQDGIYQINERSLGFRWFFTFLLFTQFRPFRTNSPQNVIFLFDEPASNLHSSAQKQLLKSFENLTRNSKIIYTTHSHHLINPHWLESTYVVRNEGLKLDNPETYNIKKTNITIQPYREFVTKHPHHTAYFQPILDVLDYSPSNLESLPSCVFLEGKSDFYIISYFNNIVFDAPQQLNMAPSTGSSNLDTLISLYIAWGRNFIVLLDSDKEGKQQKDRYINNFGIVAENKIFTLEDIRKTWKNLAIEKLFEGDDAFDFQKSVYPAATTFNKTHFNRAMQEKLINLQSFKFSEETENNFKTILNFLIKKLAN
jgi:predicted ATP-dependent endonuclease of OLD family